ncbi:MAG: LysR substrate-binding domain-containing protein [Bacillota bacterium]
MKRMDNMKSLLNSMNSPVSGTIKIGAANFMMRYKLPEILQEFKKIYPLVGYNVTTGWSQNIFKLMQDQDVNISFVIGNYEWESTNV